MAFVSNLTTGSSTLGIFVGTPGAIQTVALQGTAAPSGGNYDNLDLGSFPIALNGSGQVAFRTTLIGGSSNQGVFLGGPGLLQTVAIQGAAAPAGGNYDSFITRPGLNEFGQVVLLANLTGGSSSRGIFVGAPGSLQSLALQGGAAPGGSTYNSISSVSAPIVNSSGQVAFFSTIIGGTSSAGVFIGAPGSVQAAALNGTAAPGGGSYNIFNAIPVLNGYGEVAFISDLTGTGITTANNTALFAGLPGSMMQIVREGDLIDVDLGIGIDNRTVAASGINFLTGSGGEDGRGMIFNDDGLLIYRLTFTDGSSGIFTSAVPIPEPGTIGLLVAGGLGFWAWRRRSRCIDA